MKNSSFQRKKRQKAFRQKLLRNYMLAFLSMLSIKELKAQELPFAEPLIEPFNIFHESPNNYLDTFSQKYFFVDIDLDGDQDIFFVSEIFMSNYQTYSGFYQKNELNENGSFSNKIPFSNAGNTLSIFYNDEFQSEPKLVDIDNDGDLDKLVIGAFHYGYSFDRYIFEYIPNHSNEIDSFDFDSFIGVGEVCSSGQRRWCLTSFNFGDIDDDGDNDVLYLSTNTLYNYVDGSLTDRSVDFKLFERNLSDVDPLFMDAITNPFNLETIGNTLNLDSNTILEIFLNDVNMDGQNDISVLTLDMDEDSIPGVLNYHLRLKTFYKSSNDPVLFDENEHLIWSFNGQYAYDVDFYESSDIDPFGYLLNSFFVYSNIYLIDLDNDGDQDIFMREVKFYYSPDNYEYEVGYNTQLYYFENQSIVNSVEEMEKELNIKVYPNPIHDNFHIQLDEALNGTVEFVLYNSNGSKVYTKTLTGNNIAIERKNLPSGIYFYKLINDQQVFSGSLILQ